MVTAAALVMGACGAAEAPTQAFASVAVTPQRASVDAGAPIEVEYRFVRLPGRSALPVDGWVFVHAVDGKGTVLWTDDHQPATSPASWTDAAVVYRRTMFVPRATPAGRVRIEAGLFRKPGGDRWPTIAENRDAAGFEVAAANNSLFVVFGEGWHAAERVEQQQASEWRWSKGDARLSFRHPRRDVELAIELDQPVTSVGAQRAELRIGSDLLATITVDPGERRIHRVALPATRLGSAPTIELDLHVQPTFVPASVASLGSSDTRELGVRVFNVHVEPVGAP